MNFKSSKESGIFRSLSKFVLFTKSERHKRGAWHPFMRHCVYGH